MYVWKSSLYQNNAPSIRWPPTIQNYLNYSNIPVSMSMDLAISKSVLPSPPTDISYGSIRSASTQAPFSRESATTTAATPMILSTWSRHLIPTSLCQPTSRKSVRLWKMNKLCRDTNGPSWVCLWWSLWLDFWGHWSITILCCEQGNWVEFVRLFLMKNLSRYFHSPRTTTKGIK